MKTLQDIFKERTLRKEIRPFDKNKVEDGNFNYIHEADCTDLIKMAYKLGQENSLWNL